MRSSLLNKEHPIVIMLLCEDHNKRWQNIRRLYTEKYINFDNHIFFAFYINFLQN